MLAGRGLHASVTRPLASPEFSDAPVEPSNSNHTDDEPFLLPGEDAVRLRNPSIPERDPEGLRHGDGPGLVLGVFRFGHYGAGGRPRVWGSSQQLKWVSSITPNLSKTRNDKEMKFWAIILGRKKAIASRTTSVGQRKTCPRIKIGGTPCRPTPSNSAKPLGAGSQWARAGLRQRLPRPVSQAIRILAVESKSGCAKDKGEPNLARGDCQ